MCESVQNTLEGESMLVEGCKQKIFVFQQRASKVIPGAEAWLAQRWTALAAAINACARLCLA